MATKALGKVSLTMGGAYAPTATYDRLTVVYGSDGNSYCTKADGVSGIEPGVTAGWESYWQLLCESGSGQEISLTPTLTAGTKIAEITIDGTTYDLYAPSGGGGGSTVVVTPTLSSGTKVAEIQVDGVSSDLYAPTVDEAPLLKNLYAFSGSDVDSINENSVYFVAEGKTHLPPMSGGYFIVTILYNTSGTAAMQLGIKYDTGIMYYRRKVSGSWRTWLLLTPPAAIHMTKIDYYAFGDSLTYGAIWTPSDASPGYVITQVPQASQIPYRIAAAVGCANSNVNKGVGGAYFVGSGTNKIITAIQGVDLSSTELVTVAGGRNDSENPLGDKNSTVGDGTICGAIKEILEYLRTTYPLLNIVWIGVTPNTNDNTTIFTKTTVGGWSLNSFDEKVSELCAEYGVPYVDWHGCTALRSWASYSGAGGVYSHPNTAEMYKQMGNYAAGRVSSYYKA